MIGARFELAKSTSRWVTGVLALMILLTAVSITANPPNVAVAAAGSVSGRVFRDFNSNGVFDSAPTAAVDVGVGGVGVHAFDAAGTKISSETTAADGSYTLGYATADAATDVRIEFDTPAGYQSSFAGGTSVQFVNDGDTANYAIHKPGDYSDPATTRWVVPVTVKDGAGSLQMFDYLIDGTVQTTIATRPTKIADEIDTGTVWGTAAYEATPAVDHHQFIFSAAFFKINSGMGPDASPSGDNAGKIYISDIDGELPNAAPWFTVPGVTYEPVVATDPLWGPTTRFDERVHTEGLGDMDIAVDGSMLFVMDLEARVIQRIPVIAPEAAGAAPTAGTPLAPIQTPTGLPGAALGCDDSMLQPFGMDVTNDEIFVALTCWGRETPPALNADSNHATYDNSALAAWVYRYDFETGWDAAPAVEFPLNYFWLGPQIAQEESYNWREWTPADWDGLSGYIMSPTVTDLTFEEATGNLTINIASRSSDAGGGAQSAGDNLLACPANAAATVFTLESGGVCGGVATDTPQTTPQKNINYDGAADDPNDFVMQVPGVGGAEFYADYFNVNDPNHAHTETGLGSSEHIPGYTTMIATQLDATGVINTNGVKYFATAQHATPGYFEDAAHVTSAAAKRQGLGELALLVDQAPIEIGNRVWFDVNKNGVQDPGETPIAGVVVELYDTADKLIGTATTNADGEYYFRSNVTEDPAGDGDHIGGNLLPSTEYKVVIPAKQAVLVGYRPTVTGTGTVSTDSNGVGQTNKSVTATVTTGGPGENDHTIDFGFFEPGLVVTKTFESVSGPDSTGKFTATYKVAVKNTAIVPISYSLSDRPEYGAGVAIVDSVTVSGGQLAADLTVAGADAADGFSIIAAGDEVSLAGRATDTYTVTVPYIISDTPATPGGGPLTVASADCTLDEAGGETGTGLRNTATVTTIDDTDSDNDCGPVEVYDLTLIKTLSTGQKFMIDPAANAQVSFDVQIANQGTVTVWDIDATDYVPAGLAYRSVSGATYVAGGAADGEDVVINFAGPIAAGESKTATITFDVADTSISSFKNGAEISSFDGDDDPANDPLPQVVDIDSTPDSRDGDPLIAGDTTTDGINRQDDSHNEIGYDPDGDGNVNEPTPGDEDDHDTQTVVIPKFDLALRKTVDSDRTEKLLAAGDDVTFLIEVFNQGTVDATDISLIDYVDLDKWKPFATTSNPSGTSQGDHALSYSWTARGTDGALLLDGVLPAGDSVTVPVTLTIGEVANTSLVNTAEISAATPIDQHGDPIIGDGDKPIGDTDSTPDSTNDDPLIDDEIDRNPESGDEDDHDIATVRIPNREEPTYALGNQVWFDTNNNGRIDQRESPLSGVKVDLYRDANGDGKPDGDPVATDTTDKDGLYLFGGLSAGKYIVVIPKTNFMAGGPLGGYVSSTPTALDPENGVDSDDNGIAVGGHVQSGTITLDDDSPTGEKPSNDAIRPDRRSDLTIDFGFHDVDASRTVTTATTSPATTVTTPTTSLAVTVTTLSPPPMNPTPDLPGTGANAQRILLLAMLALGSGVFLVAIRRRV